MIRDAAPLDLYMKELARMGLEGDRNEGVVFGTVLTLLASIAPSVEGCVLKDYSNYYSIVAGANDLPTSKMPAERFLHLYKTEVPLPLPTANYSIHWKRHRRFFEKRAQDRLRREYDTVRDASQSQGAAKSDGQHQEVEHLCLQPSIDEVN